MRVAIAGMYHETNSFAVERNDKPDAEVRVGTSLIEKSGPKSYIGGFVEVMRDHKVDVVPTVEVRFEHGGLIASDVYEYYRKMIVDALADSGPLDGVFFAFHGAMTVEDPYLDPEGDLLKHAREALGEVPFVGTYDFHALMTKDEISLIVPFPNNENPHIDGYERGQEAAQCLLKMLRKEIRPVTRLVRVPIIGPNIGQSTWAHDPSEESKLPLFRLNRVRAQLEETPGVINATILGGYGYADTPYTSMSIVVTTDNDTALADRIAAQLAEATWQMRDEILNVRPIFSIDEGIRKAMESREAPVVLVDLGDDPGSSCPADSPAVLEALLRLGARDCALTIRDPEAVKAGMAAGVGATLSLSIGAGIDQRFYKPLKVTGTVRSIDDGNYTICGPTHGSFGRVVPREDFHEVDVGPRVVLRVGHKIDVILSQKVTGKDRDFFKSAGIILEEKQIIVVKSNQAHRASFDPVSARNIQVASPGACTVDYLSLPYRHLLRPIWPVDREFEWRPPSR